MSADPLGKLLAEHTVRYRKRLAAASEPPEKPAPQQPETAMARALREAQQRAQRSGNGVPMPVFLQAADCPESDQDGD